MTCIHGLCKMDFNPFSFNSGYTNGDRPSYTNGGADRLSLYNSSDRPSYSNHQPTSHQEKLEAFRKSDAERDAFVQVHLVCPCHATAGLLTQYTVYYPGL